MAGPPATSAIAGRSASVQACRLEDCGPDPRPEDGARCRREVHAVGCPDGDAVDLAPEGPAWAHDRSEREDRRPAGPGDDIAHDAVVRVEPPRAVCGPRLAVGLFAC